jgi:hypothetical protein
MKILDVPKDAEITVPTGQKMPLTFKGWLQIALDQYSPLAMGVKNMRLAAKISQTIDEANGSMKFEDAEFEHVKAAVEGCKFNPAVVKHFGSFLDSMEKVQEVKA